MPLNRDLREFIELLNTNKVDYLVVGAFAVAWHGYPRFTGDIDFFVSPHANNALAVVSAIGDFGFAGLNLTPADFCQPGQVVQLGMPPYRIDLITSISGMDFANAWPKRVSGTIDGVPVFFLCLEDLIRNKESTGRPKDLGDADELRKRRPKPSVTPDHA